MRKEIIEQFDGYEEVAQEREISRRLGINYQAEKGNAERILNRLHPKKLALRIVDIIEETESTKTLRLVSPEQYLPPFQAGQYIAVFVNTNQIRTSRAYSISSSPNQLAYYDITIRRVNDGMVSNLLLDKLKPGDILESSAPGGYFYHQPIFHDKNMVCIAGGSGITPIMSMIREVIESGLDRQITLLYGNRNDSDVIFHEELLEISNRFDNIRYVPVIEEPSTNYSGETGYISDELIQKTVGELENKTFYMCGPQAMYDFCLAQLEKLEVPARKIRKEIYGAPLNICDQPGWPSEISPEDTFTIRIKKGLDLSAKAGESLMTALERQKINLPSLCRSGECSLCRIKLLSGKVYQPQDVKLRKSDRRYGYIHACVSYPLSDLEMLI